MRMLRGSRSVSIFVNTILIKTQSFTFDACQNHVACYIHRTLSFVNIRYYTDKSNQTFGNVRCVPITVRQRNTLYLWFGNYNIHWQKQNDQSSILIVRIDLINEIHYIFWIRTILEYTKSWYQATMDSLWTGTSCVFIVNCWNNYSNILLNWYFTCSQQLPIWERYKI